MAKMKEYGRAFKKEALEIALSKVRIYPCKTCGHPVDNGYCCGHCGDSSPQVDGQEETLIEV